MEAKEFYEILKNTEVEESYPYGSCQYATVSQGYDAAKKAGVENLSFLYGENDWIDLMMLKGNKEQMLRATKEYMMWGMLSTRDESHAEDQGRRINMVLDRGFIDEAFTPDDFSDDEEEEKAELQEVFELKSYQEAITWMAEHSWDLWSAVIPVQAVKLPEELTPDVGSGPIFNVMAWESGYATGIEMAIYEYLAEEEMDWEEWDT